MQAPTGEPSSRDDTHSGQKYDVRWRVLFVQRRRLVQILDFRPLHNDRIRSLPGIGVIGVIHARVPIGCLPVGTTIRCALPFPELDVIRAVSGLDLPPQPFDFLEQLQCQGGAGQIDVQVLL